MENALTKTQEVFIVEQDKTHQEMTELRLENDELAACVRDGKEAVQGLEENNAALQSQIEYLQAVFDAAESMPVRLAATMLEQCGDGNKRQQRMDLFGQAMSEQTLKAMVESRKPSEKNLHGGGEAETGSGVAPSLAVVPTPPPPLIPMRVLVTSRTEHLGQDRAAEEHAARKELFDELTKQEQRREQMEGEPKQGGLARPSPLSPRQQQQCALQQIDQQASIPKRRFRGRRNSCPDRPGQRCGEGEEAQHPPPGPPRRQCGGEQANGERVRVLFRGRRNSCPELDVSPGEVRSTKFIHRIRRKSPATMFGVLLDSGQGEDIYRGDDNSEDRLMLVCCNPLSGDSRKAHSLNPKTHR
eukprot:TRINITY_DN7236_c0_g1_i4.p1 TRINITY_DN7236_c0_g1~~TRINITY_DN7236_c0_g1_i4.p1  ORF type:complete len:357 (-),score=67.24 TRINITY_DN7236_c0_g1_i4:494-1564(-)